MELDKKIGEMIELGDSPDINWLISVLKDNVGWNEWVPKTEEEMEKQIASGLGDYPYKVIRHPIEEGNVVDLDKGKYVIAFNNEKTRDLLIKMATLFEKMRSEYWRMGHEFIAERWTPVSEKPCGLHSSYGRKQVLITGPALNYIFTNGVAMGVYDPFKDKYFITEKGKTVEYNPTFWRELPPPVKEDDKLPYESVKDEVQELKTKLDMK